MSIVSLRYRTRRIWIRWLLGLLSLTFVVCGLALSRSHAADAPVEPEDYAIVSDEAETSDGGEQPNEPEKAAPANSASGENATSEEEAGSTNPPAKESAQREQSNDSKSGKDQSDEEDVIDDESSAEEVAPLTPAPDVPPPDTEPVPTAPETDSSQSDSPDEPSKGKPATERPAVEGASFKGIVPSVTTVSELEEAWGQAKQVAKAANRTEQVYQIKPFKKVVVTIIKEKVDTVVMHMDTLVEPQVLAGQLKLADVEPATIYNTKGQMLGMTFPERGVLFSFAPGTPLRVAQIVLEPINSQPFVTRAEKNCHTRPAEAMVDVSYALEIDPDYDRAHGVKARILCELGQFDKALPCIERAIAIEPKDPESRLTRAQILYHLHDYTQAGSVAKKLTEEEKIPAMVRAQAHKLWGDAVAEGKSHAFDQAIKHHTDAIKFAEQISSTSAGLVRRAAKELLMEAHLAVANDIAWGNWQQKAKTVPKWIDRADAFCDHLIKKHQADESIRLRVYEQTLHAFAGMKDAPDMNKTIDAMNQLGRKAIADEAVASRRQMMTWQLGEAMASAMLVAQNQNQADAATQFGQQALAYFEKSGEVGETWPNRDHIVGKVYYRLGAIQAIEKTDHKNALTWYEKAVPLLETPAPPTASSDTGRLGEIFVSMGVSFWESGQREDAVRLTQQGAKLMEAAVADESLTKAALSVPYGNLASMHGELGNPIQAKQFSELAAKADKTGTLRK